MANRNDAVPTWSGFIYQGKITILCALEKLYSLMIERQDLKEYSVEIERIEDFSFIHNGFIQELYQVKQWKKRNKWKYYKECMERLLVHRDEEKNADIKCYLVTCREIIDWDCEENIYRDEVNLYRYNGHVVDGVQLVKDILHQIKIILEYLHINADEERCRTVYSNLCIFLEHRVLEMHQQEQKDRDYTLSFRSMFKTVRKSLLTEEDRKEFEIKEEKYNELWENILTPPNVRYIKDFQGIVDTKMESILRTRSVYMYSEYLVDIFLGKELSPYLNDHPYEQLDLEEKVELIGKHYDRLLGQDMKEVIKLQKNAWKYGGNGSEEDLERVISVVTRFVEKLFIHYFSQTSHAFGKEDVVMSAFSFLPLRYRIYILENVKSRNASYWLINKLALAYVKNGEAEKAVDHIIMKHASGEIDIVDYLSLLGDISLWMYPKQIQMLLKKTEDHGLVPNLRELNKNRYQFGFISPSYDLLVASEKYVEFQDYFKKHYEEYPTFFNMLLCLLNVNDRQDMTLQSNL